MIKEQIIYTAFDLFSQYGIKSVSMDNIAKNLSISKRTLYGFFDDKETLLIEGMELMNYRLTSYLEQIEKGDYTAIDVIILFYDELMRRPRWYSQKFYEDLKKYPKALSHKETEKNSFTLKCTQILERGVKEEVFHKDINFEIVSILAKEQIKMLHPSKSFSRHSNTDVYNTVLIAFLRGISTEKGRLILDKWIEKKRIHRS